MQEIKVEPEIVTPVLKSLKTKTMELETTNPNPEFTTSKLDFIEKIQSMEEKYYQMLLSYKTALLKVETNVEEAIEAYAETDENIAKQIGSLSAK